MDTVRKHSLITAIALFWLVATLSPSVYSQMSWQWAKKVGGIYGERTAGITCDDSGAVYWLGMSTSPLVYIEGIPYSLPVGPNQNDEDDIFIVKYDQSGNVVWQKTFGNLGDDSPSAIEFDPTGFIYFSGSFTSNSLVFDQVTLFNTASGWTFDAFVVKMDLDGNVIWAKSFGGLNDDRCRAMTFAGGNLILTGSFDSPNLSFSTLNLINPSASFDVFVIAIDPGGNPVWGRASGGSGGDESRSITSDFLGIYLAGDFTSNTFVQGSNSAMNQVPGLRDVFIAAYDANGNERWLTTGMGNGNDYAKSIITDTYGNLVLASQVLSDSFRFGNQMVYYPGGVLFSHLSVLKITNAGIPAWMIGNSGQCYCYVLDLEVDVFGSIYLSGHHSNAMQIGNLSATNLNDEFLAFFSSSGIIQWLRADIGNEAFITKLGKYSLTSDLFFAGEFIVNSLVFGTTTLNQQSLPIDFDTFLAFGTVPAGIPDVQNKAISIFQINEDQLQINCHESLFGARVDIYDLAQRKLISMVLNSTASVIQINNIAKGIYCYTLCSDPQIPLTSGKIAIIK